MISKDSYSSPTRIFTVGEKEGLSVQGKEIGLLSCEVFDRERMRIALDSPDGLATRFQYLQLALSEAEQASFFARWGDDIQAVIATGFERVETVLRRVLFLEESRSPLSSLTVTVEFDDVYQAEEIGHFRMFCTFFLRQSIQDVSTIIFASADRSNRIRDQVQPSFHEQASGIKHGRCGGQWESNESVLGDDEATFCRRISASSSVGMNEVSSITASFNRFRGQTPLLRLYDFDRCSYSILCNKSLAEKVARIHVDSDGYAIHRIGSEEIRIEVIKETVDSPVEFTDEELKDPWVILRPEDGSTFFAVDFFDSTPIRLWKVSEVRRENE